MNALHILGIGSYVPEQKIDDSTLSSWGLIKPADSQTPSKRRTSVDISYLAETKNRDIRDTLTKLSCSCTDMGERAALQAIERANISLDQMGLVDADCATPVELTPAESQRVAGRLGLKVPAYDLYSTSGIMPNHLSIISAWKEERIPPYVLCVSTNAPTQRVNYATGDEAWYYSDGAVACVISTQDKRGLKMLSCDFCVDVKVTSHFELDSIGYIKNKPLNSEQTNIQLKKIINLIQERNDLPALSEAEIYWDLIDSELQKTIALSNQLPTNAIKNSLLRYGNSLGSTNLLTLARDWGQHKADATVALILANGGINYGSVVLQATEGA